MISFTVRMKFRTEDRQRVAEILPALARESREEPGCVSYDPHIVDGEPDMVVIYEQYKDDAALEAHRTSPHFLLHARKELPKVADRVEGHLYEAIG